MQTIYATLKLLTSVVSAIMEHVLCLHVQVSKFKRIQILHSFILISPLFTRNNSTKTLCADKNNNEDPTTDMLSKSLLDVITGGIVFGSVAREIDIWEFIKHMFYHL